MSLEFYSDRQLQVLEALETYRFLTVKQMIRLGISVSENSLRDKILRPLKTRRKAPIKAYDLGRWQKLPHIYVLTEQGARDLAEYRQVPVAEIRWPKGGVQFSRIFHHRIAQIDFHIAFREWAGKVGADIEFVHMDFDKTGSQRTGGAIPLTRVDLTDGRFLISDGEFCFSLGGQRLLYCLEIHNETDTKRIAQQLLHYTEALEQRVHAAKYKLDTQPMVLSVLLNPSSKSKPPAIDLLNAQYSGPARTNFAFLNGFEGELGKNWISMNGSSVGLFPK